MLSKKDDELRVIYWQLRDGMWVMYLYQVFRDSLFYFSSFVGEGLSSG